ncbi:MAG: DNA polymerase III subunit alpha, partial [Acidimicrobiia bacterium]|nr:DNA polymerase III subunit alpha [Acidimicrobiia bacterium]
VPIQRKPESGVDPEQAPVVTQYEMHGVEDLGLLKMDFLGLRNLDVISDALELIRDTRDVVVDIDRVDLDDAKTYELLSNGDTIGVFQLESGPMRALMRSLRPESFDDVAALVALYRPGPMEANMHNDYADRKNGRKPVELLHEDAAEILADTYGLMIYQESMMRVAQKFAGYSLADADNLRKACGKKIREVMAEQKEQFVAGCVSTGYGPELGEQWWEIIEPFADYAFNKSHSYGYGYIAYQIAYLKAHYPIEYLSALLTSVKSSLEKAAVYLNECRVMGIEVVVPDINLSRSDFHPLPDLDETDSLGQIVFGLSAVRNVGVALVELILAEREHNGPFTSFIDFCERVDLMVLNKRTIESMIKAGTFDSLGHPRKGLLTVYEQIIDLTVARRREHDMGVMSLFGELDGGPSFDERPTIPDIEFDKMERLRFEKEMLGLYISDHPVMGYEAALRRRCDSTIGQLAEANDGDRKRIGGVITNLQKKWTRKGDLMAIFELEDLEASIEVMVFPKTMTEHGHKLTDDVIAVVQGRVERRDDLPKMFAQTIDIFDTTQTDVARPLRIQLAPNGLREETIERLQGLLADHPGDSPVLLHVGSQVVRLPDDTRADTRRGLVAELRVLLGPDAVVV